MSDENQSTEKEEKPKAKKKATSKKKNTKKKVATKKKTVKKVVKEESKPEPPKKVQPRPNLQFETKREIERGGSKGVLFALILAIVVVIIAGGWYQTQQLNKSNQDATVNLDAKINSEVGDLKNKLQDLTKELQAQKEVEKTEDREEMISFSNPELGISFEYPKSLGTIVTEVSENDEENPQDSLFRISFTANPDLWLTLAGPEYKGEEQFIYNGTILDIQSLCPAPLEIDENGYCDTKQIGDVQVVESVEKVGEDNLLNVVKTLSLPLNGSQYTGLTLNLGLGLPPVTGRSLFAPTDGDIQQEALLEFYRNIVKKEKLSIIVRENLELYEQITLTVKAL